MFISTFEIQFKTEGLRNFLKTETEAYRSRSAAESSAGVRARVCGLIGKVTFKFKKPFGALRALVGPPKRLFLSQSCCEQTNCPALARKLNPEGCFPLLRLRLFYSKDLFLNNKSLEVLFAERVVSY